MGRFFSYDNSFMTGLGKICDCMILGFFWTICSIPIFTIGAATAALYYSVNKSIRYNRGYAWKEYWHGFRANFKQATIVWLLNLLVLLISLFDSYILRKAGDLIPGSSVLAVVMISFLMVLAMWMLYAYPYMARFSIGTKRLIKNAMLIAIANFGWTILLLLIFAAVIVASMFVPVLSFFSMTIYMVIANRILERVFRKYMTEEDREAEEERNRVFYN